MLRSLLMMLAPMMTNAITYEADGGGAGGGGSDGDGDGGGAGGGDGDGGAGDGDGGGGAVGGQDARWYDVLPENLRTKNITRYRDLPGLARGHDKAQAELSRAQQKLKEVVTVPGENATPNELEAYRQKTGVPKDAGDYRLKVRDDPDPEKPSETPFGLTDDQDKSMRKLGHTLGLNEKQLQGVVDQVLDMSRGQLDGQAEAAIRESNVLMEQEYGRDLQAKRRLIANVESALGEDFVETWRGLVNLRHAPGKLGTHHLFLKTMIRMGELTGMDRFAPNRGTGQGRGADARSACRRIGGRWTTGITQPTATTEPSRARVRAAGRDPRRS